MNCYLGSLEVLTKSGAILSSVGVVLFITFVAVLLIFPVAKQCENKEKCSFSSSAPGQLKQIVQPGFLALSLLLIAAGVLVIRISRRHDLTDRDNENSA